MMTGVDQATDNITLCFATINRPDCVRRFVTSVRQQYPQMRIIVGEQSDPEKVPVSAFDDLGIDVERLPYDSGVCKTRNHIVSKVKTKYFLLADDDFVFGDDTNFDGALAIMEANNEVGIVGGRLFDLWDSDTPNKKAERHWERLMFRNPWRRSLSFILQERTIPRQRFAGPYRFFETDIVLNWALMRTSIFHDLGVQWDPQFKIVGEHEDFYLSLHQDHPDVGVVYFPDMIAYHRPVRDEEYEGLRMRTEGWRLFREKWEIDEIIDHDFLFDTRSGEMAKAPQNFSEFIARADEISGRQKVEANAIGIDRNGALFTSQNSAPPRAGLLLVNPATGKVVTAGSARAVQTPPSSQPIPAPVTNNAELERLRIERDAYRNEVEQMRTSTTWRVMAPVRAVIGGSPRLRTFLRRSAKLLWWTVTLRLPKVAYARLKR